MARRRARGEVRVVDGVERAPEDAETQAQVPASFATTGAIASYASPGTHQ